MKSIAALCTTVLAVSAIELSAHQTLVSEASAKASSARRICYEDYRYNQAVPSHEKYITPHGWKLVRRVKAGKTWHPAKDHAVGSEAYGTCDHNGSTKDATFSCKYDNEKFDQMLFTSGDNKVWL